MTYTSIEGLKVKLALLGPFLGTYGYISVIFQGAVILKDILMYNLASGRNVKLAFSLVVSPTVYTSQHIAVNRSQIDGAIMLGQEQSKVYYN